MKEKIFLKVFCDYVSQVVYNRTSVVLLVVSFLFQIISSVEASLKAMFVSGEDNFFFRRTDNKQTHMPLTKQKITLHFFPCHLVTLKHVTSLQLSSIQETEQHNLSYHTIGSAT